MRRIVALLVPSLALAAQPLAAQQIDHGTVVEEVAFAGPEAGGARLLEVDPAQTLQSIALTRRFGAAMTLAVLDSASALQ